MAELQQEAPSSQRRRVYPPMRSLTHQMRSWLVVDPLVVPNVSRDISTMFDSGTTRDPHQQLPKISINELRQMFCTSRLMNQWERPLRIMQHPWAPHSTEQIQVQQFLLLGPRSTTHTQQQMCTASCRGTTITQVVQSPTPFHRMAAKEPQPCLRQRVRSVTLQTLASLETTRSPMP